MYQHKLLDIVDKLLGRSELGKVNWHASEAENTYLVTYSRSSFSITSDEVEPQFYRISAINENAVEVDSLEFRDPRDSAYTPVEALYNFAKRQAMGVEKVLDTLLQEIEDQSMVDDFPF